MEDLKEALKEIRIIQIEINNYKESISLLHNSLKYEVEHRRITQDKIKELEGKIEVLEKEVNESELKIKEIEQQVNDINDFKKDVKTLFWKVLFIVLTAAGTVIATYYSSYFNK